MCSPVKLADVKREHRQKRFLLFKIGEVHELFKEESNVQIGKSKFAELRPPQVIPSSAFDHKVCICKYHENIDLLLQGLSRLGTSGCISSEEPVANTVCSLDSCKCIDRVCNCCGVTELTIEGLDKDDSVSYYQWQKVEGAVKKNLVDCTIAEAEEDLQARLRPFSCHVYNIRCQFEELRHLKEQLSQDEIIIHEDFSENFQLKHQREIMESHWSNESVTVFTTVVYYKDDNKDLKHLSYVLISDEFPMIKEVFMSSTKLSWMLLVEKCLSNRCTIGVMGLYTDINFAFIEQYTYTIDCIASYVQKLFSLF